MRLSHQTERDLSLTHQVMFHTSGIHITISCNCRFVKGKPGSGRVQPPTPDMYEPIGITRGIKESRALYNDPKNHRKPFGPDDKAKW